MSMAPRVIDLRSDTITQPTNAMRRAMAEAELGDDVYGEDPTINRLEETAAARLGKEAGLFVVSGSMGNLVSALSWCNRGDEAIMGADAHLLVNELGAIAAFGGVQMRPIPNDHRGLMTPEAIEATISPPGLFPRTALLCLENTHNRGNGAAFTVEQLRPVVEVARAHSMAVHMDGARIFNASVALGVPAAELASVADSVTFCLSKGLSCPVGSVVCGSREFITRARHMRKMVGAECGRPGYWRRRGSWRSIRWWTGWRRTTRTQSGWRRGWPACPESSSTRATSRRTSSTRSSKTAEAPETAEALKARGVLANGRFNWVRFVTRNGITAEDIDEALDVIGLVAREGAGAR